MAVTDVTCEVLKFVRQDRNTSLYTEEDCTHIRVTLVSGENGAGNRTHQITLLCRKVKEGVEETTEGYSCHFAMDEMQLTDGDVFITFNTESENYRLVMTTAESAKGFRKAIEGIVSSSCTTAKPLVGRPPQFSGCPETGLSQSNNIESARESVSVANISAIGERPLGEEMTMYSIDPKEKFNRYLRKMTETYKNKVGSIIKRPRDKQRVYHKCIAALICDQNNNPFVATIATGTHWNNDQACYWKPPKPCSMHAESLCYDAAPIFFQMEMLNCYTENKASIFTHDQNKMFKLKKDVEFHLLITGRPCGWCTEGNNPCYEWKQFASSENTFPHVPTCSSKILISSKMGIQGYVSHLLEEPIFVKSVIILCDKSKDMNFATPNLKTPEFHLLDYDPDSFNEQNQVTFVPLNRKHDRKDEESSEAGGSYVINIFNFSQPYAAHSNLLQKFDAYEKDKGLQDVHPVEGFTIANQNIPKYLEEKVDKYLQDQRIDSMIQIYKELKNEGMSIALDLYIQKFEENVKRLDNKLKELTIATAERETDSSISVLLVGIFEGSFTEKFRSMKEWTDYTKKLANKINEVKQKGEWYFKNLKMLEKIKETPKEISLDCSWDKYFAAKKISPDCSWERYCANDIF